MSNELTRCFCPTRVVAMPVTRSVTNPVWLSMRALSSRMLMGSAIVCGLLFLFRFGGAGAFPPFSGCKIRVFLLSRPIINKKKPDEVFTTAPSVPSHRPNAGRGEPLARTETADGILPYPLFPIKAVRIRIFPPLAVFISGNFVIFASDRSREMPPSRSGLNLVRTSDTHL